MVNWLERARCEIPKMAGRGTANSAERNLMAVTAVCHLGKSRKIPPLDSAPRRHAYRFRLHNGEGGGTYISEGDLATAHAALLKRYGLRLALVVLA